MKQQQQIKKTIQSETIQSSLAEIKQQTQERIALQEKVQGKAAIQSLFDVLLDGISAVTALPACENLEQFQEQKLEVNCLEDMASIQKALEIIKIFLNSNNKLTLDIKEHLAADTKRIQGLIADIDKLIVSYNEDADALLTSGAFKVYQKLDGKIQALIEHLSVFKTNIAKQFSLKVSFVPWTGKGHQLNSNTTAVAAENNNDLALLAALRYELNQVKQFHSNHLENIALESVVSDEEFKQEPNKVFSSLVRELPKLETLMAGFFDLLENK